jgi:hypothetical protein
MAKIRRIMSLFGVDMTVLDVGFPTSVKSDFSGGQRDLVLGNVRLSC